MKGTGGNGYESGPAMARLPKVPKGPAAGGRAVGAAEQPLVALTMAPEAADRFLSALIYASARIPQDIPKDTDWPDCHADWLRWGSSRLDAARRALASVRSEVEPSDAHG